MRLSLKMILSSFLLLSLFSIAATGFAEERKDEWKSRNYAFGQMKIILWDPTFSATALDGIRHRIVSDQLDEIILHDKTKKLSQAGLNFISRDDLCRRIEGITGENMTELAKSNPAHYDELLKQYTALYCTNILRFNITAFGETQKYVPEQVETYETQKQVTVRKTVTNSSGQQIEINETTTVPVTESRVVPAHYLTIGHAGLECTLLDVATGQPVWQMVDIREATSKGPDGMMERILKRSAERLAELKK
ncbi:MAG TPA: hypothetical protein VN611_03000 [Patescibacteria group bacterium]|nr:hypothetical protein [Patescibacteria group bacterium]